MSRNNTPDIFVKQSEIKHNNIKPQQSLLKTDVLSSIPENYVTKPDTELSKTMIEWRWRFFKLPNKSNEVVEISYKAPNQNKKYVNNKGEWVESSDINIFDAFITSEYYCYSKV
jgi:hypothetical protein